MASLTYPAPMPPGCAQRPVPAAGYSPGPHAVYVVQSLPAGFPSPAADYTADPLDLNQYLVDRVACTFLFDVAGWSMRLAGIHEGDKVVVDRSVPPHTGDIVVAIVNDEFIIKRLFWTGAAYELHPDNPDYQPIRFKDDDVLQVFGVVVGVLRKVRG
ncbi:LexA family protein [Herbaspirillum robiniae]|uniref:LexA family protein n=1 Tax=Herbaspirillum robiniae TaxID=2014887 RepID=UPI001EDB2EBA|nr:translesion error-prone DNA polymerase V autoproteolytic subunit [Herbaspirillum robiniae]